MNIILVSLYSKYKSNIKSKIKNSKEGKILLENFVFLYLLQIASYAFPFITLPYLSKVLEVDGFGKVAFASAVIVWFQTITDWGFNYTATRDVAKNRDNLQIVKEIYSNVLWSRFFLIFVSLIVLLLFTYIIPIFKDNQKILLITFLIIPGHVLSPNWFFQAMEKMKYITMLNVLSKSIFTGAVFLFIKDKNDYMLQPLFTSLGFIMSGVISLIYIYKKWGIIIQKPNIYRITATINNSTNIFLKNISHNMYNSLSIVLVGLWGGPTQNGILDAGRKFYIVAYQLITIISQTFFPFLSRRSDKNSFYIKVNIIISMILSFSLFLLSPFLIKVFFSEEFLPSINIMRIYSISILFLSVFNIYSSLLMANGNDTKIRNVVLIGSFIGLIVALPLVYFYHSIGAAITYLITNIILAILSTFQYKISKTKKQCHKHL